ncbi:MAG: M1 family aminopeptidase [Saprospiraceae bacterium]
MKYLIFTFIGLSSFFLNSSFANSISDARTFDLNSGFSDYDLLHYHFRLNVETNSRALHGSVVISARSISDALDAFEFQLHDNYAIDSVVYNDQHLVVQKIGAHRKQAILPVPLSANKMFSLTIYYRGNAPLSTNNWGNGIVQKRETKYNTDVFYTLSVPYHAYEWFPCKQVLTDLIDSVKMTIITQIGNSVISNGSPVSDVDLLNGKHAVTWKSNYPTNYYLISFNVGKYVPYHFDVALPGKSDGSMPVMNFLYNQTSIIKQKPILDQVGSFLGNYSNLFGLYPFHKEKFGTVIVPLSGGMEHQTIVNLATDYDKYLVAHEMAHQWWGDNINLKSYHDVWLSEGWATYSEYLTAESLFPAEAKNIMDTDHNNALRQASGRTYIADTTNFNTIYNYDNVYMKGAVIAHTLRAEIANDSLFFSSLANFQKKYSHKSADVADFKATIEKETGKDLSLFFDQWYYGFGYPKFAITWANKDQKLFIKSVQTTSSANTPLFKTNIEFSIKRVNFPDTIIVLYQDRNDQTFFINGFSGVTGIVLDPRNVILNRLTSMKQDQNLVANDDSSIEKHLIEIFPNPVHDVLNIRTKLKGKWRVEIYAENGRQIFEQECLEPNLTISLHTFSSKSVIIKVTDENEKIWSKLISILH